MKGRDPRGHQPHPRALYKVRGAFVAHCETLIKQWRGGSEGKKSHRERYAEKNQGFCLPCQGHVLNHMKNVPWHVGMVADQRPFSWHVALAEPFSNCPSGQWKVQADP